jgi:hypothetical protein
MESKRQMEPVSKAALWTGRILSILVVLFFLFDAAGHLLRPRPVVEAFAQMGFPLGLAIGIGIVELICIVLYAIRPTEILGAILLTGYLGGAVASQVRVGNPAFETAFPVIIGVLAWAGVFLRDRQLRQLISLRG